MTTHQTPPTRVATAGASIHRPRISRLRRNQLLRIALAVVIGAALLFPVYWMVVTAVSPIRDILTSNPKIIPNPATLSFDNFLRVFEIRRLDIWLRNSAVVTLGTTLAVVVLSTMAGYGLSRVKGRLGALVGLSLFGIRLVPTTLLLIPFFIMFASINLRNHLGSLIIANTVVILPFASWIMKSVYDAIPEELEEAALVDGANRVRAFTGVVLPVARSGIGAVSIFTAISAWSDFAFARTLVQGDANTTVTVGLVSFIGEYTIDWGALMAAGLISIIPMVVLFVILEPLLVSGLTSGAVK